MSSDVRTVENFKGLVVWQKAMDLAELVHALSLRRPREETYGLGSQLRRAGVSVPSNIAEAQQRRSSREFLRFLSIALGSLAEIETQLLLAIRFGYLTELDVQKALGLVIECQRMTSAIRTRILGKIADVRLR